MFSFVLNLFRLLAIFFYVLLIGFAEHHYTAFRRECQERFLIFFNFVKYSQTNNMGSFDYKWRFLEYRRCVAHIGGMSKKALCKPQRAGVYLFSHPLPTGTPR